MSAFTFNVEKHSDNYNVQINVQCDEPFCPFQNTKLCKRNILKVILQKNGIVVSESKLNKGEYQIQFYVSKSQYTKLKPFFKRIDEHLESVRNPGNKSEDPIDTIPSDDIDKPVYKKKTKPQRRTFQSKRPIFEWIRRNYKAECRESHIKNQFFMVHGDKVIGFISLNQKDGVYSVNELNLVDAEISI